ncbi:MAG TPA: propanediol utilization protein [Acidimicrobiia bacterium]|nr:propanediol utilization protein [Acidimicrobiia bacterium]
MPYDASDEFTHKPGEEDDWQESIFLCWYDEAAGIGGLHRLGQEPNLGLANVWCGLVTDAGTRFRREDGAVPFGDRGDDGIGGGPGQLMRAVPGGGSGGGPAVRMEVREPGCALDLDFTDFHPMLNLWTVGGAGSLEAEFAPHHYEASGRVTGTVRLDGRTYEIDGLGHRDHSWGVRRWETVLAHRWCGGTFGPSRSFSSVAWHATDGSFVTAGWIIDDGEPVRAESLDVVIHQEPDGLSHRGGDLSFALPDGREVRVAATTVDGVVFGHRGYRGVDAICRAESDGRRGFCDLEASTRVVSDGRTPVLALRATLDAGVTRR